MKSTVPLPAAGRFAGIEWMRGFAAFGVICIHAGLAAHNRTTPAADELPDLFGFAVPFFLVTSFFFAVRGEEGKWLPWSEWMQRRAVRLLVPYAFWSAIYFALHAGELTVRHQSVQVEKLLLDPASLILNGGDSLALYFLPLLFIGLVLIHLLSGALKRLPWWGLVLGLLAGLALHNLFHLYGPFLNPLFASLVESPLRLMVGVAKDGARCVPLIFLATILSRYLPSPASANALPVLIAGLALLIISHVVAIPGYALDSITGSGVFLMSWGLSGILPVSSWAVSVGLFSFGVYLVHQVYLELIQLVSPYRQPAGVIVILAITAAVYIASMLTVGVANRGGSLVRRIFGLK